MTVIRVRIEPALGIRFETNANCLLLTLRYSESKWVKLVGLSASAIVMEIRQYS